MVDYHIHTDHSGDGKTPTDVMIASAVEKGLREICITSHYDTDSPAGGFHNFELDFPVYIADVSRSTERYGDRISIKLGVEVGLQAGRPHVQTNSSGNIRKYPFDFVIASTHFLPPPDLHRPQQWIDNDMDKQTVQQRYLQHTLQYLEMFDDFDVIGHLTYYSRFSPEPDKAAREMIYQDNSELYDRLFETLIARDKGIEVNTSMKGTRDLFSPDFSIVRRFYEMGGRIITVGSDAHLPAQVGAYYDEALKMLREAGFSAICTFDRRQPKFLDI